MKKLIHLNLTRLPLRYKFRFIVISMSLLVNTWALASLVPNKNISLTNKTTHPMITTEKLSLSFSQKKATEAKELDTLKKIERLKEEQKKAPKLEFASNDKLFEKKFSKAKALTKPAPEALKYPKNTRKTKTEALKKSETIRPNNQTAPESKNDVDLLAQNSETHNPLVSEPSFSKPPEQPRYPALAKKRGQEGTVWLEVWLDAAGEQIQRKISESSGINILDKAALKAVSRWEFLPYRQKNMTIASRVKIPVQFVLN